MSNNAEALNLELNIRGKPPESVRAWWTDLPDDYHANDPKEQPIRILTTRRLPNGREIRNFWRLPDGSTLETEEILILKPDGSWTIETKNHPTGLRIFDEFRVEPTSEGTKLLFRSVLTPKDSSAASHIAAQKERMTQVLKTAATICERDAP